MSLILSLTHGVLPIWSHIFCLALDRQVSAHVELPSAALDNPVLYRSPWKQSWPQWIRFPILILRYRIRRSSTESSGVKVNPINAFVWAESSTRWWRNIGKVGKPYWNIKCVASIKGLLPLSHLFISGHKKALSTKESPFTLISNSLGSFSFGTLFTRTNPVSEWPLICNCSNSLSQSEISRRQLVTIYEWRNHASQVRHLKTHFRVRTDRLNLKVKEANNGRNFPLP